MALKPGDRGKDLYGTWRVVEVTETAESIYRQEVARLLELRAIPGRDLPTPDLMRLQAREEAQQGRVDRAEQDMLESREAVETLWAGIMRPRGDGPWSPMYWDLRS